MNPFPSLFLSHGSPMFALEPGIVGPKLTALGKSLGTPRAIVMLSPHWMTRGDTVFVSAVERPKTIYDFGGFDPKLRTIVYPAPGAPDVAREVLEKLAAHHIAAQSDTSWGLDHGAWVPLTYLFPNADVPVLQISMPQSMTSASACALGQALRSLGESGILLIGSGSLTHNLYEVQFASNVPTAQYASEFESWVRDAVTRGDADALVNTLTRAPHAQRAHPTTEHLLPLMFAVGAASSLEKSTTLEGGILYGVLSMMSFAFGAVVTVQ